MRKKLRKILCLSTIISTLSITGSSAYDYDSIYNIYSIDSLTNIDNLDEIDAPSINYYIPQGITLIDDNIVVSMYDYFNINNSRLVVLNDKGKIINNCMLDNDAHVGGISYDSDNELIWVSGNYGCVNAYKKSDLLSKNKLEAVVENKYVGEGLKNYLGNNSVSFLEYDDGYLYVGCYSNGENGIIKKYKIYNYNGNVYLYLYNSFKIPEMVQGLTFYNKGESKYMLLSRSSGTKNKSIIQVFKYNDDYDEYNSLDSIINIKMPNMLEQVTNDDNKLYTLYESYAFPYRLMNSNITDSINVIDIDKINIKK